MIEAWILGILIARYGVYELMKSITNELRELESTQDRYTQDEYIYLNTSARVEYTYLLEEYDFYEDWLFNIRLNTHHNIIISKEILV